MTTSKFNRNSSPAADPPQRTHAGEECIVVLQGGGALGSYQAGMFEALSKSYPEPAWVAGISIGAINAALIAGNPAPQRVARLREFWELVISSVQMPAATNGRETLNEASATQVMMFGVPGFFVPRFPPAPFQQRGTLEAISYYDTAPLLQTLERLVDFDLINSGSVRLSVGAVNVRTGNFEYFDSARQASVLKSAYVTAKHGLIGLCKTVAKEGGKHGIRANVICPGFVRTPLVEKQIPEQAAALGISQDEVIKKVMLKETVDGEFTTVQDVAEVALLFASFGSNALTGQSLVVSHGWFMQ